MQKISGLIGALALMFAVTSCGGDSSAPPPPPPPPPDCPAGTFCMGSAIFYTAASFTDATLTVARNTAVTWTNDSGVQHDVIFDTPAAALAVGSGSQGNIPAHISGSNQRQFATAGTYRFRCTFHPPGMTGTVIVQ